MNVINQLDQRQPYADVVTGAIQLNGKTYYTLEHLPIPKGTYTLVPHVINEGRLIGLKTYCLVNDQLDVHQFDVGHGRFAVLFHPGNFVENSIGCILVGTLKDTMDPKPNVGCSKPAFDEIIAALGGTDTLGHTWTIQ